MLWHLTTFYVMQITCISLSLFRHWINICIRIYLYDIINYIINVPKRFPITIQNSLDATRIFYRHSRCVTKNSYIHLVSQELKFAQNDNTGLMHAWLTEYVNVPVTMQRKPVAAILQLFYWNHLLHRTKET